VTNSEKEKHDFDQGFVPLPKLVPELLSKLPLVRFLVPELLPEIPLI
jgi:hypothetical protein